jgi:uracil-DNA glycosylase
MTERQNDMSPEAAAAALRWLAEMGADEIIGESAVDRLQPASPRAQAPQGLAQPASSKQLPARGAAAGGTGGARGGAAGQQAAVTGRLQAQSGGPPAVSSLESLADIEAALARFDQCPLKKTATSLCYADGNPQARIMVIGEAPDRDEDIQGKPFVGRPGQLLDRMLASIGLSRTAQDRDSSVFITNVIFWRPPGNRSPTEAETNMCVPFLLRTIELQKPDFIVCLGPMPAHKLTGRSDGILKMRGKWTSANVSGRSIPLLPTLHPAYLLRHPAQKRLAWRDLLALRQMLDAH